MQGLDVCECLHVFGPLAGDLIIAALCQQGHRLTQHDPLSGGGGGCLWFAGASKIFFDCIADDHWIQRICFNMLDVCCNAKLLDTMGTHNLDF